MDEVQQQRLVALVDLAFIYLNPAEMAGFRTALAVETDEDARLLEGWTERQVAEMQKAAVEHLERNPGTHKLLREVFETLQLNPARTKVVDTACKRHGTSSLLGTLVASMCAACPCPIRVNRKREYTLYCSSACRQAAYRQRQKEAS